MNDYDRVPEEMAQNLLRFSEALLKALYDMALKRGDNYTFRQSVAKTKSNENNKPCIICNYENNITSPAIYPEDLYKQYANGQSIEDIAAQQYAMLSINRDMSLNRFDPSGITHHDLEEHIYLQVLNKDLNPEIMKACPYIDVAEDLIAIPRYEIGKVNGMTASLAFSYQNMEFMHITKEELLDIARQNTANMDFTVKSMTETLSDIFREQGMPEDQINDFILQADDPPMYVISNATNFEGSAALLSDTAMQETYQKIGSDYYIIPSSRFELLAVPDNMDPEDILSMVTDVNRDVVSKADYLATNVYKFDSKTHELTACFNRNGEAIDYGKSISSEIIRDTGRGL